MKRVYYLEVTTVDGREYIYEDDDAESVYKAINSAGARGAEWTTPAKLYDGSSVVFITRNITQFKYETEESE